MNNGKEDEYDGFVTFALLRLLLFPFCTSLLKLVVEDFSLHFISFEIFADLNASMLYVD